VSAFVSYSMSYNASSYGKSLHVTKFVQALSGSMVFCIIFFIVDKFERKKLVIGLQIVSLTTTFIMVPLVLNPDVSVSIVWPYFWRWSQWVFSIFSSSTMWQRWSSSVAVLEVVRFSWSPWSRPKFSRPLCVNSEWVAVQSQWELVRP